MRSLATLVLTATLAAQAESRAMLSVHVRDGATGKPVAGAEVWMPKPGSDPVWSSPEQSWTQRGTSFPRTPNEERFWNRARSTSDGVARVPRTLSTSLAFATHEHSFGSVVGSRPGVRRLGFADEMDVVLWPDHSLAVRVLSESGRPVAGIGVAIVPEAIAARSFESLVLGHTNAEGHADFLHVQNYLPRRDKPPPARLRVALVAPGLDEIAREVALIDDVAGVQRFVIPGSGSLSVRLVDQAGQTVSTREEVELTALDGPANGRRSSRAWLDHGTATWPHVGLGRRFKIVYFGSPLPRHSIEVDGPTSSAPNGTVALTLPAELPVLRGTIPHDAGIPWRNQRWITNRFVTEHASTSWVDFTTDDEGHFAIVFDPTFANQRLLRTHFFAVDHDLVPTAVATFAGTEGKLTGVVPLPAPEVRPAELLVRVRYAIPDADRSSPPGNSLERPDPELQWVPHEASMICSGPHPDGFEIRGLPLASMLRLNVTSEDFEATPARFAPGFKDVVIERRGPR